MTLYCRSAVALAAAALAVSVHAQDGPSAQTIFGTYEMVSTHNCVAVGHPAGQSPLSVHIAANGLPQVIANVPPNQPGVPPALNLLTTVARFTMVINPRSGTVSSDNVLVTRLDQNRAGGQSNVLQRTMRTLRAEFTVDRANDTLLLGARTQQGTLPNGDSFVLTHAPGARFASTDSGQTIFGAGSDMIEEVITGASSTSYNSIVCDVSTQGHRISPKY